MKKGLLICCLLLAIVLLTGCAKRQPQPAASQAAAQATMTLEEELNAQTPSPAFQAAVQKAQAQPEGRQPASRLDPLATDYHEIAPIVISNVIDFDLSRLTGTMAYASVGNIMQEADKHVGKTIRMRGMYNAIDDPNGEGKLHFALVFDNAACCELGVELLSTSRQKKIDYPSLSSLIEVTGVLDVCSDGSQTFQILRINDLTVLHEGQPGQLVALPAGG